MTPKNLIHQVLWFNKIVKYTANKTDYAHQLASKTNNNFHFMLQKKSSIKVVQMPLILGHT